MQFGQLKRREFITLLGGAAAVWPMAARAQQTAMPVVGFSRWGVGWRTGLGCNRIPARPCPGRFCRRPQRGHRVSLGGRSVRSSAGAGRRSCPPLSERNCHSGTSDAGLAAKAATTTIPIVFGAPSDPVKLGLVASLIGLAATLPGSTSSLPKCWQNACSCCANWCRQRETSLCW